MSIVVALSGLALASCGSRTTSLTTPLASAPGVTSSSVLFASEVDTDGANGQYASDEVAGIRAVLRLFDEHHGIFGRQLSVVVKDNAGQTGIATEETQYLSATVGAFALIGDSPSSVLDAISTQASSSGILQLYPIGQATGANTVNTLPSIATSATNLGRLLSYLDLANGTIAVLSQATIPTIATDLGVQSMPEELTYTASGQLQGVTQLTTKVPDLVVSFAPASVTSRLLAELASLNEAPTVIAVEDSTSRQQLRAESPTFHGDVLRLGTWVPRGALDAAWGTYLNTVDRLLSPKIVLNTATLNGIYSATMSVELLRSVGLNPTRRAILTNLAQHRFTPAIPALGPWSATMGFQGEVLTGTIHPLYVNGAQVTLAPPSLSLPPKL
ncbi:ABC transporter substrate-binding protein [Ferrimicrobium sp.]|uniref:ABC transporter substrate-binding protein n=1 Tax=Ferrimicrobium sp. TaxID=2926050 RepID=UPI0026174FF8|nr:ABC transporter substrate-binding protein [Ferrimicrobium sp.]